MKTLIIILSLVIGINLTAQQKVVKETSLAVGFGYNPSVALVSNAHINFKLNNNILLRAQIAKGSSKASDAPQIMTNRKPKDEVLTGGLNFGYAFDMGKSEGASLNLLAGISKVNLTKHTNFNKIENEYLDYGNNNAVNTLVLLPLNLLTSLKNEYTYKTETTNTFALTFTPELDFKLNKMLGLGFNSTIYLMERNSMADLNMFMKLRF